jgi:hypothetical protein
LKKILRDFCEEKMTAGRPRYFTQKCPSVSRVIFLSFFFFFFVWWIQMKMKR